MNTEYISAKKILSKTGISVLDAARIAKNILDAKPNNFNLTVLQFCAKVVAMGLQHIRTKEMTFADGFALYLESKQHLRPDSIRDIRCIGNRLLRTKPELGKRNFSELSVSECEEWLNAAFHTDSQFKRSANEISPQAKDPKGETAHKVSASQFNKARTMLHGLFEFALRREWCDKPDKANRTPQSRRKGNRAFETCRNKTANQNRPARKSRIRRRCRTLGLHWNPPARSPPPHLARHRHRRKDNHRPLTVLEDRRRPPSGNSACLKQASNYPQIRKLFVYLPYGLATPLAQNPR